jgi:uncharacterized membrane protein YcfT
MGSIVSSTRTDIKTRVEWIDCARGVAITLVVFHHAVIFLSAIGIEDRMLASADNLLVSVRMPLFFLAAGLFAKRPTSKSWRYLWTTRLALLVWIYTLWTVVRFVVFTFVPWPLDTSEAGTVVSLAESFVLPSGTLWFIYALVLYYLVARLFQFAPTYIVLAGAGVISTLFSSAVITTGDYEWDSIITYLAFFLAGCRLRELIINRVESARAASIIAAFVAFAAISGGAYIADMQGVPGVRMAASIAGIYLTFVVCKYMSSLRGGAAVSYLGRTTMPIYLLHYFLLAFLVTYAHRLIPGFQPFIISIVSTLLVVATCLVLYRITRRIPGLYEAPNLVKGSVPS